VRSGVTISGSPPTRNDTAGVPHASDSCTTIGRLSHRVGRTNTSAALYAMDLRRSSAT
jgi:hypothetical protein